MLGVGHMRPHEMLRVAMQVARARDALQVTRARVALFRCCAVALLLCKSRAHRHMSYVSHVLACKASQRAHLITSSLCAYASTPLCACKASQRTQACHYVHVSKSACEPHHVIIASTSLCAYASTSLCAYASTCGRVRAANQKRSAGFRV